MSLDDPSRALDRLGDRKIVGSIFSASLVLSKSYDSALRLGGDVTVEVMAVESVRFMFVFISSNDSELEMVG